MPRIDIGIACAPSQSHDWWTPVFARILEAERTPGIEIGAIRAVGSALPDHNKNYVVDDQRGLGPIASREEKRRNNLTDANRANVVGGFLYGKADYLWFLDDDTVPPKGALKTLLSAGREIIGGVYYLGAYPHNPIAYQQVEDGTYAAILDYPHNALFPVDSIGMGCTLIHRSVFERIMSAYTVMVRPNGSLVPVPNDSFVTNPAEEPVKTTIVENGVLKMPLTEREPEDTRPWPFYALEYGRTEDHHFCELARSVGVQPYLDTSVVCDHFKLKAVNRTAHKMAVRHAKQGESAQ